MGSWPKVVFSVLVGVGLLLTSCGTSRHTASHSSTTTSPSTLPPTSALPVGCGEPGSPSSSSATVPFIAGIAFASPQVGWAVGQNAIWGTRDGGAVWTQQYNGPGDFSQIDVFDQTHAWATSTSDVIVATTDGSHWTSLPEPAAVLDSIHFTSPESGIAVAGGTGQCGGILLETEDGGQHWQQIASPPNVQSACFSDASHGWLAAGVDEHVDIFYSANGGRSWVDAFSPPLTKAALSDGSGVAAFAQLECAQGAIWALYTGTGGCASNQCSWFAYHGSYPGPWTQVFQEGYIDVGQVASQPGESGAPAGYPGPFSAISASNAIFVGDDVVATPEPETAVMLVSNDGTAHMQLPNVSFVNDPSGVAFLSSDVGSMTGEMYGNGCSDVSGPLCPWVIAGTTNGGETWTTRLEITPR